MLVMNGSDIVDGATVKQLPSIRRALLWRLIARMALTFLLFCIAIYFLVLQPATTQIGSSEMQRAAEQAETQNASVVGQIERIALTGRAWGMQNQFELSDQFNLAQISAFNRIFIPVINNQSQITSILFANNRGQEVLLLNMPNGAGRNRLHDTPKWAPRPACVP